MNIVATFEGPTGQAGTLGVRVVNPTTSGPTDLLPHTSGGIAEIGTTGIYFLQSSLPDAEHFIAVWDLQGEYAGEGFTTNPGSGLTVSTYEGDTGLVGSLTIEIVNADSGASDLLAPTTSGIFEIGASGVYYWAGTLPPAQHKIAIWTVGGAMAAEEIVSPPVAATQFAVLSGIDSAELAVFWIKRNDTQDIIAIIAEDDNGSPKNLTGASCKFNMAPSRDAPGGFTNAPTIHADAFIADSVNGIIAYIWQTGDTAVAGTYDAEFEVHFADGSIQTFPNTTYITVNVIPDIDPGL